MRIKFLTAGVILGLQMAISPLQCFAAEPDTNSFSYVTVVDEATTESIVELTKTIGPLYGITPGTLLAIIEKESKFKADAFGAGTYKGLMQTTEIWQKDRMDRLGVTDLFDPYGNILVCADYLYYLQEYLGTNGQPADMMAVLMYYHCGEAGRSWYASGGRDPYAVSVLERAAVIDAYLLAKDNLMWFANPLIDCVAV